MKTTSLQLPVYSIRQRKQRIDPKPAYQRGAVWSLERKQLLIDSLLRGYDIPKIYLRAMPPGGNFEYEVVDGQQRLRTIWEFLENAFPLGKDSIDFDGMENLDGKYFDDLSADQQDMIGSFSLTIADIRDASDIEVRELFLRLQEGASLTPPEKRNAMVGNMRDFIHEVAQLPIFLKTTVKNDRFQHADYASHITAMELAAGPTDVKAADLKKMYEVNIDFDLEGAKAKKIKKVLNFMDKVFPDSCNELKIKWGFVDLYWLISTCMEQYDISGKSNDFFSFYIGFELNRNQVTEPSELLAPGHTPGQRDLYDYISAFQREGAIRSNLESRAQIYLRTFLEDFPDAIPKDKKRLFNESERIVIWRKAFMRCQNCSKHLTNLAEMHADHIIPHSRGGITSIENAQCLCITCNQSKSNKN
jgi:hypothetical protein